MRQDWVSALATGALLLFGCSHPAAASCVLPNQLTNGQTADATQVMANFSALVGCLSPGGTANSIQFNNGSGGFGGTPPLATGQLLMGVTGAAPTAKSLTAGPGITINNGSSSVTITSTAASGNGLYAGVLSNLPTQNSTNLASWLNQGSASVADNAVGVSINAPAQSGDNVTGLYEAAPTAPYTLTVLIAATRDSSSYSSVGLGFYNGGSKLETLFYSIQGGSPSKISVDSWTAPNSHNAVEYNSNPNAFSQPIWLMLKDDGTNVSYGFSNDGVNYISIFTEAKSSGYLGASGYSNIGFLVNPTSSQTYGTLMSWKISSP